MLKQRDLLTGRWRTVRELTPSELQLHISLVAQLRWTLRRDVEFYHAANGEVRDKRTAAKLKAMGVKPGVSDLIFRWGPPLQELNLELKSKGSKLTPEQAEFGQRAQQHGAYFAVADTIEEAIRILKGYGLLT